MNWLLLLLVLLSSSVQAVDQCFYETKSVPGLPQYDSTSSTFTLGHAQTICSPYAVKNGVISGVGTHVCSNGQTLTRYAWNCNGCCNLQSTVVVKGCPGAQIWDPATNSCQDPPPPPCQVGELVQLSCVTGSGTVCHNGCLYAVTSAASNSLGVWVGGQGTGAACSTGSGCQAVTAAEKSTLCTGTGTEAEKAIQQVICDVSAKPCPEGEVATSAGCAAELPDGCVDIAGEVVCAGVAQNCVVVNGEMVCASEPDGDGKPVEGDYCYTGAGGSTVCFGKWAKTGETGTTTTVVDPVTGQVTKTSVSTKSSSVAGTGSTRTTTVTVFDSDGNELSRDVQVDQIDGGVDGPLTGRALGAGYMPVDVAFRTIDWGRTFDEVKVSLSDAWAQVPIVQSVQSFQNLSLSVPAGTCPPLSFDFFGTQIFTTVHCDFVSDVMPILQGLFLAIYGMTAIRIVLSA